MTTRPLKRLVVFCDGTWCGRETGTLSNVRLLANEFGQVRFDPEAGPTDVHTIHSSKPNVVAGYQEGIGLNKTFLEYVWDGATGSTIGEECVSVYKFIVDHYTDDHEIWMFGLSRGSYTVRCVAAMINNCGIIRKSTDLSAEDISTLCEEVYRTYRSPLEVDHPQSRRCVELRKSDRTWSAPRPVRLIGVLDTVGSLGIPRVSAGVGFDWPEFYDQKVSNVVQELYHAVSLHDRLWAFEPCLAFEGSGKIRAKIHQKWFPGCHYDLGRQEFRFIRQTPVNQLEKLIGALPARLSKTIYPNEILADLVLRWMFQAIQATDPNVIDCSSNIQAINRRLVNPVSKQPIGPAGSGDIYGDIVDYGPAGSLWSAFAKLSGTVAEMSNKLWPNLGDNIQDLLGIKTILKILTATKDRKIPGNGDADIYQYKEEEIVQVDGVLRGFVVNKEAKLNAQNEFRQVRYPSRTFESWQLWKRVF